MAQESVYAVSSVSGTNPNPSAALGAPDGVYGGTPNTSTSWTHRWALTAPAGPEYLAVEQNVSIRVKKGTNSNSPTASFSVYQGGTLLATRSSVTVSGVLNIPVVWTPAAGAPTQSLEVQVVTSAAGGSPSARNGVEIDAITATLQTEPAQVVIVTGSGSGSAVSSATGAGATVPTDFVQMWPTATFDNTTPNSTSGPATTAGNTLFLAFFHRTSSWASDVTITDSAGNTWTQVGNEARVSGVPGKLVWCRNAASITTLDAEWKVAGSTADLSVQTTIRLFELLDPGDFITAGTEVLPTDIGQLIIALGAQA